MRRMAVFLRRGVEAGPGGLSRDHSQLKLHDRLPGWFNRWVPDMRNPANPANPANVLPAAKL